MFLSSKILTGILTTLTVGATLKAEGDPYHGQPIQEKQVFSDEDGLITRTVVDQRDNVWVATTKGIMLKKSGDKIYKQWTPSGLAFGTIKGDVKIIKAVNSSKIYIFMTMNGITGTYPNAGTTIWVTDANDPSTITTLTIPGVIKNISAVYANDKHVLIGGQTPTNDTQLFEYDLTTKIITKYGAFPVLSSLNRIDAIYQGSGNWFDGRVVILTTGPNGSLSPAGVKVGDNFLSVTIAGQARTTSYAEKIDKTIHEKIWNYSSPLTYYDSITPINVDGRDRLIATGGTDGTGAGNSPFMELDASTTLPDSSVTYWRINGSLWQNYAKSFVFVGNSFWSFLGKTQSVSGVNDRSLIVDWTERPTTGNFERPIGSYTTYKSKTEIDLPAAVDPLMSKIPAAQSRLLLPNFAGDSLDNIYFGVYNTMFFIGEEPIETPNADEVSLSAAEIAGIVIGSVAAGAGLGVGGYVLFKKFKKPATAVAAK